MTMASPIIAILGTYPPRRCGIATFTEDLAVALPAVRPAADVQIVAMNDGGSYAYPAQVTATIEQADLESYEAAADALNARSVDLVCVQHEFGIFGGPDGSYLLTLLRRLHAPIVTTLHTVLERFTPGQAQVVEELTALSSQIVVMSERAISFLVAQGVPRQKIVFVPHGVPDLRCDREFAKAAMGLSDRALILTFGLLSPNKGIETAIRALPELVRERPDVLYIVLGETHPHIRAQNGEAYRHRLMKLAADIGVAGNVRFDDTYSDLDGLTRVLAAADMCLLPYQSREQITSGTLAYAVGNGRAVVSTPFWHAEELLADGRGMLTPFGDHDAMSRALRDLLRGEVARADMERRCRIYGARMRWSNVAHSYGDVFAAVRKRRTQPVIALRLPAVRLDHVMAFTDSTGMMQHATVAVPNLREGYSTDDNARALHLAALVGEDQQAPVIARRTLSFLDHAFNPAIGRYRNFMAYDRRWLDEDGGDNVQARTLRALVSAAHEMEGGLRSTAREILARSWSAIGALTSPRAQAIALIALAEHADNAKLTPDLRIIADSYAANLLHRRALSATPTWRWFERSLSYSNAKLPHGLIAYGRVFASAEALDAGLDALDWLETQQTAPDGTFLPIGCERVYGSGEARPFWDGQPVEVYATVAATLEAHRATGNGAWLAAARRALEWLFGRNLLGLSLYDPETGGCRDGLHRDRTNANQGAESTLALWISVAEYERASKLVLTSRIVSGE